ncbi:hypothetical protein JVT61DRAFT_12571 [Boletus reticuloceps]|uniref:Uncharacterized protein n=1 Tax=Boletus reticuloceps TaxID=495285 RepID=A0A8I2YDU6_9AGAM|nr:hypothetical protein JVT61DRAFT_12571 [Boletus reticuloceps]
MPESLRYPYLSLSYPEAVSQAIALLRSANLSEVRFCLSDGHTWIFFVLKSENGMLIYYESAARRSESRPFGDL